jgi:hypothetical protein
VAMARKQTRPRRRVSMRCGPSKGVERHRGADPVGVSCVVEVQTADPVGVFCVVEVRTRPGGGRRRGADPAGRPGGGRRRGADPAARVWRGGEEEEREWWAGAFQMEWWAFRNFTSLINSCWVISHLTDIWAG